MGLGSREAVSLKLAREERDKWRSYLARGIDPIAQREKEARENATERPTVEAVARQCFDAIKSSLKDGGKASGWFGPVKNHILPKLGAIPIEDLTQIQIRDALAPIWKDKAEVSRKAMQRLGQVLKHGAAMGLAVDLHATEKAKALLGAQGATVKHVPSMPWQECPTFFGYLTRTDAGVVDLSVAFTMLTASRPGPVRREVVAEIRTSC